MTSNERAGAESDHLPEEVDHLDASRPLAVILVGGDNGLGPHMVRIFQNTFKDAFQQILFAAVGVMDYDVLDSGVDKEKGFKGSEEAKRLKRKTRENLDPYLKAAHDLGTNADCRVSIATTHPADELASLAEKIVETYPKSIFFVGKLVFEKRGWFHWLLHSRTSDAIRMRLEKRGIPVTVIPVVLRT